MKQYLNFKITRNTYSIQHSFNLIFKRIETVFFSFLCIIFLVVSKVNSDFSKDISFTIVGISMPVVKFAAFPFNTILNLLTDFHQLVQAKEENKILKEDLEKMRSFYIKSLNIHQENKELRTILNFVNLRTTSFKVAKIIGRSNQVFNQKLFIDAGKNRDIKDGSIVTGNHAVIGRISEVGDNQSRLMLLTDANSHVPIISSRSRARGILVGDNSGTMEILYLPKKHGIEVGDLIFTSGDGDTLPPGLLIGVVKKSNEDKVMVSMVEDVNAAGVVTVIDY